MQVDTGYGMKIQGIVLNQSAIRICQQNAEPSPRYRQILDRDPIRILHVYRSSIRRRRVIEINDRRGGVLADQPDRVRGEIKSIRFVVSSRVEINSVAGS